MLGTPLLASPARGGVPGGLAEDVELEIEVEAQAQVPAHPHRRDQVVGQGVAHRAVPALRLDVDIGPEPLRQSVELTPGLVRKHGVRTLGRAGELRPGVAKRAAPTIQVANLERHALRVGPRGLRTPERLRRPVQIAARLPAVGLVEETVGRRRHRGWRRCGRACTSVRKRVARLSGPAPPRPPTKTHDTRSKVPYCLICTE